MKKINRLFILIFLLTAYCNTVTSQKTAMYAQTTTQLQLEKNTIQVDNFTFADVLGPENQIQHTASFNIAVNSDAATKNIIRLLQVYTKEKASRQLLFINTNYKGEAIDERVYDNTIIEEISFSELNALTKDILKATVKVRAGSVKLQKGGTNAVAIKSKSGLAFSSNFSLSIGNLPATRVTKISGLSIQPDAGQYTNFTIEVMSVDGAAWNQWFLSGAGGLKTEQGVIRLLAFNLKDVLFNISLMDVEIVSYSGASGNQQGTGRSTIGLRMKGMVIK